MNNQITNTASSNGIGFLGVLTLIFVVAKVLGFITWSWWLVFSPMLIGFTLVMALLVVVIAYIAWADK